MCTIYMYMVVLYDGAIPPFSRPYISWTFPCIKHARLWPSLYTPKILCWAVRHYKGRFRSYLCSGWSNKRRGELLALGSSRVEGVEHIGVVALYDGVPERQRIGHVSAQVFRLFVLFLSTVFRELCLGLVQERRSDGRDRQEVYAATIYMKVFNAYSQPGTVVSIESHRLVYRCFYYGTHTQPPVSANAGSLPIYNRDHKSATATTGGSDSSQHNSTLNSDNNNAVTIQNGRQISHAVALPHCTTQPSPLPFSRPQSVYYFLFALPPILAFASPLRSSPAWTSRYGTVTESLTYTRVEKSTSRSIDSPTP